MIRTYCCCLIAVAGVYGVLTTSSHAQDTAARPLVKIKDLDGVGSSGKVRTPRYETDVNRSVMPPQEWGRIRVEYDSYPEWIDEMSIRYYVLLRKAGRGETKWLLLEGTVAYVNIEKRRGHLGEMYVRPQTIKRHGDIVAVAAEISVGGQTQAQESKEASGVPRGWMNSEAVPKGNGLLLNRTKTPFHFVNYDDFETIR